MPSIRPLTLALFTSGLLLATAAQAQPYFQRIASFHVETNLGAKEDPNTKTSAEIIEFADNGHTLVYTDSPGQRLGFIDIRNPRQPKPAGTVAFGGEPTSVVVSGNVALVGIVTLTDYKNPRGYVATVDVGQRTQTAVCDLGGQPDSLTLSPDGQYLAVVVENERDEKLDKGKLPQLPAGNLTVFRVTPQGLDCASRRVVDLTGLAQVAPTDPEPEYVDINAHNQAVVTLQENNHLVIVDLPSATVVNHFPAGKVSLKQVDSTRDGVIALAGEINDVPREPDAVKWLDNERFVTADEGDYEGGSRGFTVFHKNGTVLFADDGSLERHAVRLGHFPEKRADKKGVEPEGMEVAIFEGQRLMFVGTERASLVAVYRDNGALAPTLMQTLVGGVGPEGLKAHPGRGLLVTASEADGRHDGRVGSVVTIYQHGFAAPDYPTLVSDNDDQGLPIGWGALSSLAAHPQKAGHLFAVTDSFYKEGRILRIDATRTPARIVQAMTVTEQGKPAADLDLEGIAVARDGGFWLVSEGNPEKAKDKTHSQLIKANARGQIERRIDLPAPLQAMATRFGFEGVTVGRLNGQEVVWVAVQREWKDDPKGHARLLAYFPATQQWQQLRYPLTPAAQGWVGLSEITATRDGLVIVERDNQIAGDAAIKQLTLVANDQLKPVPLDAKDVPVVRKTVLKDLLPIMKQTNGYVLDKVEGFAIDAGGVAYAVTDNDGVDGTNGETQFMRLGQMKR